VSSAAASGAVTGPKPETIIEGVVQRYALAYSALDARAVTRVFPAERAGSLRNAFSKLKTQNILGTRRGNHLDPNGQAATVYWSGPSKPCPRSEAPCAPSGPRRCGWRERRRAIGNIVERR
jgi:hypothetical protein